MLCTQCQTDLQPQTSVCPQCGRFVDDRFEQAINYIEVAAQGDMEQARSLFERTLAVVPEADRPHFRQRVSKAMGLSPEAEESSPDRAIDETIITARTPAAPAAAQPAIDETMIAAKAPAPIPAVDETMIAGAAGLGAAVSRAAAGKEAPAAKPDPPKAVQPPAQRPQPPKGKGNQTIFMDFNQPPADIVRIMDEVQQQSRSFSRSRRWIRLLLLFFLPAGCPFVLLDLALGYNFLTFSLVAFTLWLAAIVGFRVLARAGRPPKFEPRFHMTQTIFNTIRDDVAAGKTLNGWLDLSGAEQESKKYRSKKAASGRPVSYYKDEWLNMKARLHDGSVLRVSLFEKRKVREGYWKRSAVSGKRKFKSGSSASEHYLRFSVSVAPGSYELAGVNSREISIPNSRFLLERGSAENDRVTLSALADEGFDAWDILYVLRFGYDHLQPIEGINS